jgi:hypothetical protein
MPKERTNYTAVIGNRLFNLYRAADARLPSASCNTPNEPSGMLKSRHIMINYPDDGLWSRYKNPLVISNLAGPVRLLLSSLPHCNVYVSELT